jgi:hypothetical protein
MKLFEISENYLKSGDEWLWLDEYIYIYIYIYIERN